MNYVEKGFVYRLPGFAVTLALALLFWWVAIHVPPMLEGVSEVGGFLSWIVFALVGGVFLVRALFFASVLGDNAIASFLKRLGVNERWSRRRVLKDSIYIIAIVLAAAAVLPFFGGWGNVGGGFNVLATYVILGTVLLFVYDIGRTVYKIAEEKASLVAGRLLQTRSEEIE